MCMLSSFIEAQTASISMWAASDNSLNPKLTVIVSKEDVEVAEIFTFKQTGNANKLALISQSGYIKNLRKYFFCLSGSYYVCYMSKTLKLDTSLIFKLSIALPSDKKIWKCEHVKQPNVVLIREIIRLLHEEKTTFELRKRAKQ